MHKKITQFNTLELKDGVRVAITYSTFKEDGTWKQKGFLQWQNVLNGCFNLFSVATQLYLLVDLAEAQ